MVAGSGAFRTSTPVLADAVLVERIAALSDRSALAELDSRHGMTLYAIAYTLLLNPDAADVTVAATLREVWRRAASFSAREQTVGRWLAGLARRAVQDQLRRSVMSPDGPRTRPASAAPPRTPTLVPYGHPARAALRWAWAAAALVLPLILLS
jgi:DNA-directed RNA polymerase specialized sigma24 family protein